MAADKPRQGLVTNTLNVFLGRAVGSCGIASVTLPIFEIALMLARFGHVSSGVVNVNHGIN